MFFTTCSNSQRKTHQIALIRQFEPQKICNEQISGMHKFKFVWKLEN